MISPEARARVVAAFRAGATCQQAADKSGVSLTTAWKIARAEGIALRSHGGHNRIPPAKRERVAEMLRNGEKLIVIESGERVSLHTIWRIGLAASVPARAGPRA